MPFIFFIYFSMHNIFCRCISNANERDQLINFNKICVYVCFYLYQMEWQHKNTISAYELIMLLLSWDPLENRNKKCITKGITTNGENIISKKYIFLTQFVCAAHCYNHPFICRSLPICVDVAVFDFTQLSYFVIRNR